MNGTYAIGDLVRATGVKPTTLRWYEQEGWLPPPGRTEGGHRAYGEAYLRRLGFIRHARELGFESHMIRALLDLADRPGADCGYTTRWKEIIQVRMYDDRSFQTLGL